MTAKEYLKSIEALNAKIDMNLQHISNLKAKTTAIGPTDLGNSRVQSSKKYCAPFEDLVLMIQTAEAEANKDIDRYIDLKREAIQLISMLENKDQIDVLRLRYFEGKTFEEIAVTIRLSWRHTIRVHGHALQNLQKIMDK